MNQLIHCPCGHHFPINTIKHPYRKTVYCPHCHSPHENKFFSSEWKPNKQYWEKREPHLSRPFTVSAMRRMLTGAVARAQQVLSVKTVKEE